MSSALALPRTGFKFVLTVREGPDTGATFQLLPPRVSIGRGTENNVVLNDPRMSRNAAVIEFSMEKIVITEISNRNSMSVNGHQTQTASIKDRDVIRIGDTEFTFFVEALPLVPAHVGMNAPGFPSQPHSNPNADHGQAPGSEGGGLSGKQKFYAAIVVAGLLLAWLMNSEKAKKAHEITLQTADELAQETGKANEAAGKINEQIAKMPQDQRTRLEEAHRHFLEGFRDYQNGQWVRAMESFGTARSLNPQHPTAARYQKLAEKKRDELIGDLIREGKAYRDKQMYTRCSAQLDKVLDILRNPQDLKYQNAEAIKKECDAQLELKSW